MPELSSKKPVRRRKAASSPMPVGPTGGMSKSPTCGHSGCTGAGCNVRYMGPTTHIRDHHVMDAARHASQVWTAAIVAGLAVVLTGTIAWQSVSAKTTAPALTTAQQLSQISARLMAVENKLNMVESACTGGSSSTSTAALSDDHMMDPATRACRETCASTLLTCDKAASSTDAGSCRDAFNGCLASCGTISSN